MKIRTDDISQRNQGPDQERPGQGPHQEHQAKGPAKGRRRRRSRTSPANPPRHRSDRTQGKPNHRAPNDSRRKQGRTPQQKRTVNEVFIHEGCSFGELPLKEELLRAVQSLGYERATPIQAGTIPTALEGRDVIGQAQTGSGKTAAFGLALLERLTLARDGVEALVICPTRELAAQVTTEIERLAVHMPLRMLAAVGGHDIAIQTAALQHGVDVVVGTPGRILDLMYRGILDLGAVQVVVVDEADEMLKMGFVDDVEMILSCLPPQRQSLLFSATMPDRIRRLASRFLNDPVHITVQDSIENVPDIDQLYLVVAGGERDKALVRVLQEVHDGKCIVFCRTKARVHQVMRALGTRFKNVGAIEGDMPQHERDRTMRRFRRGDVRILVATDVVSRGIDVQDVACVINYDCPHDADSYVHRVGRTGRAGSSGIAVTFVEPKEKRVLKAIERRVGRLSPLTVRPPRDFPSQRG